MADIKSAKAAHKRQKIQDSNRLMFLWVTGASVVVGFAAVIAYFLWQQMLFKSDVASKKEETVRTIRANNDAVEELQSQIQALRADANLAANRAYDEQNPVDVILDALPADPNQVALGSSLQTKLIGGVSGVRIERLQAEAVGDPTEAPPAPATDDATSPNALRVSITLVSTDPNKLREVLQRFERSIRVIDITRLSLERSETEYTLAISAQGYYEPAKEIVLTETVVKP